MYEHDKYRGEKLRNLSFFYIKLVAAFLVMCLISSFFSVMAMKLTPIIPEYAETAKGLLAMGVLTLIGAILSGALGAYRVFFSKD